MFISEFHILNERASQVKEHHQLHQLNVDNTELIMITFAVVEDLIHILICKL